MRILFLALLLMIPWTAGAETLDQATKRFSDKCGQLQAQVGPDKTWGQNQALEDLGRLQAAMAQVAEFIHAEAPYAADDLTRLRRALESGMNRFKTSSSLLDSASSAELLTLALGVDHFLAEVAESFDGRALPPRPALAGMDVSAYPAPPNYRTPQDLAGDARNMRLCLNSLRNFSGGRRGRGILAASSGWESEDLHTFNQAVFDYENACMAPYGDVRETRPAYLRLQRAYDRLQSYQYNDLSWHDIERTMDRLQRFYSALP